MLKKIVKKLLCGLGRYYYRTRFYEPVYCNIFNRKGRRLYRQNTNYLSREEESIVSKIKENGIAISHVKDIGLEGFYLLLKNDAEKRLSDSHVEEQVRSRSDFLLGNKIKSKDYFLIDLIRQESVLDAQNPFIKFSLSPPILNIVNSYLKLFSKFRGSDLKATIPMPEGARNYASQQWHRDPEDKRLVKVFLYLNDVDQSSGPFNYLKYSHDGGRWRELFPMQPPSGSIKMPFDVDSKIPKEDVLTCTGPAGTIIFCDTSGLHKGGYSTEKSRIMYTSTFTSEASVCPIRYTYSKEFSLAGLSPQVAYALENDLGQKEPKYY